VKYIHALTLDWVGASKQWNLAVEPHSCPSRGQLVLDDKRQLCSMTSVTFHKEIDASILCQHFGSIYYGW
jgi:hypothetical protein